MASVLVYDFTQYNIVTDETVHSARPATLEEMAMDFIMPKVSWGQRVEYRRTVMERGFPWEKVHYSVGESGYDTFSNTQK
jgi:hypothetical protein